MNDAATLSFHRSFPTSKQEALDLIKELLQRLQDLTWGEHETFSVHLALEEALMNAIKHGNREDPSKQVHVDMQVSPDYLRVRITDEGKGFDPSQVPDPTADENLELTSGRGIVLMQNFMSSVNYEDGGRTVVMMKQRER